MTRLLFPKWNDWNKKEPGSHSGFIGLLIVGNILVRILNPARLPFRHSGEGFWWSIVTLWVTGVTRGFGADRSRIKSESKGSRCGLKHLYCCLYVMRGQVCVSQGHRQRGVTQ